MSDIHLELPWKCHALSELGFEWTLTDDQLTIHTDHPPTEEALKQAYQAWQAAEAERASQPTVEERLTALEARVAELESRS